jgi:hypothetical protein
MTEQAKLSLLVKRWRKGANSNRLVVQAAERGQSSAGPPYVGECRLRAEILDAHAFDVEQILTDIDSTQTSIERAEKLEACLSTIVYWHDECGHVDSSWWGEARSLVGNHGHGGEEKAR